MSLLNHINVGRPWLLTIACITSLLLGGCASLPRDIERPESHVVLETANTRLGREIEPVVRKHPSLSGFHALSDGKDAFAVRFAMIKQAEKTIDVQYYIWHDDLTVSPLSLPTQTRGYLNRGK